MENQKDTLTVSVRVYPVAKKKGGNLLAFANAALGGCFAINGIRVIDSEKGKFVAMPRSRGKDGKYHDICFPTTSEMHRTLSMAVLEEYDKVIEKDKMQNTDKQAAACQASDML